MRPVRTWAEVSSCRRRPLADEVQGGGVMETKEFTALEEAIGCHDPKDNDRVTKMTDGIADVIFAHSTGDEDPADDALEIPNAVAMFCCWSRRLTICSVTATLAASINNGRLE